ncbi:MAG: hypothetical protein FWF46_05720 [Oscillospiraceae bacterium]|nr:hypothetical protein [Oscillospiraceae bacterium]
MEEKKALTAKILIAVIVVLVVVIIGLIAYVIISNNYTLVKRDTANQNNISNIVQIRNNTLENSILDNNTNVYTISEGSNNTVKELTKDVVNDELVGTIAFGFNDNNNLIAIKNDGSTINIFSDSQFRTTVSSYCGTSNNYAYSNGYLYFIISRYKNTSVLACEVNIYSINLKAGDQNYSLTKVYTISKNVTGTVTDNIKVYNNNIYFSDNDYEISSYNLLTNQYINIKTFTTRVVRFDVDKINNILYYLGDGNIYKYDISTGTETLIESNADGPIIANNSGLVYESSSTDDYNQYNLKTNSTTNIVNNVQSLITYNDSYIYIKDNSVYISTNNQETKLYSLINYYLAITIVGNKLQICDEASEDYPERTTTITMDLTNNTQSNDTTAYFSVVNVN